MTAQRPIAFSSMDTPADRNARGLTPEAVTEVSAALTALEKSLPQNPGAYADPRSGWIAQRIVGITACAMRRPPTAITSSARLI